MTINQAADRHPEYVPGPLNERDLQALVGGAAGRHFSRGEYAGHTNPQPRCPECLYLAGRVLARYNTRHLTQPRAEAMRVLANRRAIENLLVDEVRADRVESGRLAKPLQAGDRATFRRVLGDAARDGLLCESVEVATALIGLAVAHVQDPTGPIDLGRELPFNDLARTLNQPLPPGVGADFDADRVEILWRQIEAACARRTDSLGMLTAHYYRHTEHRSRHVAPSGPESGTTTSDPIAGCSLATPLIPVDKETCNMHALVAEVTSRAISAGTIDRRTVARELRRGLFAVFGELARNGFDTPAFEALVDDIMDAATEDRRPSTTELRRH